MPLVRLAVRWEDRLCKVRPGVPCCVHSNTLPPPCTPAAPLGAQSLEARPPLQACLVPPWPCVCSVATPPPSLTQAAPHLPCAVTCAPCNCKARVGAAVSCEWPPRRLWADPLTWCLGQQLLNWMAARFPCTLKALACTPPLTSIPTDSTHIPTNLGWLQAHLPLHDDVAHSAALHAGGFPGLGRRARLRRDCLPPVR